MDGRIDLSRARRDAKALLRKARAGEAVLRADRAPCLADAQHAVAVSLGAPSWPALLRLVEAQRGEELLAAARDGRAEEVYRLLVEGAPVDARSETGGTVLHVAAERGWADVIDVLAGWVPVDRAAVDDAGETALDVARDPVVSKMLAPRAEPAVSEALGEAMWAAEAALFELFASVSERRPAGDGFAFRTGEPDNSRNGVVCSRADDVRDVLAWLDAPAQWMIGPGSTLGPRLERAGCRPERSAVFMAAEIGDVAAPDATISEVEVLDDALLAPLWHFAAWRNGEAVGRVTVFLTGSTLLGVNLEVARGHRRTGIGRALVRHALAEGARAGCALALLGPTPATVPFYEALGFTLYRCLPDRVFYSPFG